MDATEGQAAMSEMKPNEVNVTATEIVVRAIDGFRGIKLPAMDGVPTTYYPAADDGYLHFPKPALAHATLANELLRAEEKAARTISERAQLEEMKKNSTLRLESAITKAIGGQADVAAQVAATVMTMMPEIMRQMREQMEADRASAQSASSGSGKGKNA
jgi:hypothetical protein